MKKSLLASIVLIGLLAFTGSAWSITVGSTDVGGLDTFIPGSILVQPTNSGDQAEIDWVNLVLGSSFTVDDMLKYDTPEGAGWVDTDTDGVIAHELTNAPEYFFVKIGAKQGEVDHLLFENEDSLDWAVIALSTTDYDILNIGKLSHLGEIGGGSQVPEPGMLMLFGTGLLGLGLFGRKKFGK